MINSKITNTKKVFKDFAKYSVKTNITMKIIYTLAVLILAASVVLFISNHILDAVIFTVLGVIFALCAPAMQWLNVSNNKSNVGSVDEFQFYEDRFVVTSFDKKGLEISDSTLFYSRLYKVKKYLNYGYIYVNKAVAYIVDKNEFEDEKQFNEVLDRISQAIIRNKKNKGTTPVVFGSQNVTAPTEEPPQDLGEPVPPPPTEEDLAYEEEQKENKRITEFEGEQKIDYEGNVTVVAVEDKENEEASEDTAEENDEEASQAVEELENEEDASEPISEEDDDDNEGDETPAEQTFDVETTENENQLVAEPVEQEVEDKLVEDVAEPAEYENIVPVVKEEPFDNADDSAPVEQVPVEQEEYLAPQAEETIAPVEEEVTYEEPLVAEETPVVVAPVEQPVEVTQTPVVEEKPAEDKAEEDKPKRKRGRPAGSTKKPKTEDGEEKPKRKRGRPAGTTKKKPAEKKTPGKRGRPVGSTKKSKNAQADKPKGKRGRPAKPKTAEELNKPKVKRGRPPKKKVEEVETQPAQDVAVVEEKPAETPVVVAPVMAEQTTQQVQPQPVEEPVEVPQTAVVEEAPVVEEYQPVVENQPVANYVDDNNDDEGDETPAEQQPVNFDMPSNLGEEVEEEVPQQVSQEDLDEVAALQAEYNMTEEDVAPQDELQVEDNLLNEEQPFVNPVAEEAEEDFENIEGPADLGNPTPTTYQPPVIEDTEEDNDAYDAENETFTVSTGDEGAVEPQEFDNNTYAVNDDNNDDINADDIGDISVNIDDVSAVVDNMPEDVEEENSEEVNIDEFPTDIDDDTTRNI
ncbi:MAG: hypothetical protein IJW32_01525 [Clostridia bacterium]|nr:hypothetical protein [Clostridia bacterium]